MDYGFHGYRLIRGIILHMTQMNTIVHYKWVCQHCTIWGSENPPHPEIWITYFLRMMELYSNKVCELSMETNKQSEQVNLSYLNKKDKELLAYLIENKMYEFKPVDVAGALKVTNKTVINRCAKLYSNGFVVPVITGVRIMAYRLTDYTISNADTILKNIL